MENGGSSGANQRKITGEEVLTKLKDDGDFDKLRLKIIRRLKDDGELRNNIISIVKQSSALNCPGAENMKPRQLSDAIQQEIGSGVMSQISDSVWKIIRSSDGMKAEITETVQSVYNKLLNPELNECGESSHADLLPVQEEHEKNGSLQASTSKVGQKIYDGEPIEPPGFSMHGQCQNNTHIQHDLPKEGQKNFRSHDGKTMEEPMQQTYQSTERSEPYRVINPHLGTSEVVGPKQSDDDSDDPDVPPGFG